MGALDLDEANSRPVRSVTRKGIAETGVTLVRNPARYLSALVAEYRAECATGFASDYRARLRLWHAALVVFEVSEDPDPWLDRLRDLSLGHIRPSQIETTIRSAERKAARP
jgi:hypothetical protein